MCFKTYSFFAPWAFPANICLDEDVLKTSFVFVFRRRLGQDQYIRLGHTSLRRLQDVLQKRLQDIFKTSCQDVFKTSSKRLQGNVLKNVFKTSSRRLQEVLQRYLQDVFKRYHQVKVFLLTRL